MMVCGEKSGRWVFFFYSFLPVMRVFIYLFTMALRFSFSLLNRSVPDVLFLSYFIQTWLLLTCYAISSAVRENVGEAEERVLVVWRPPSPIPTGCCVAAGYD